MFFAKKIFLLIFSLFYLEACSKRSFLMFYARGFRLLFEIWSILDCLIHYLSNASIKALIMNFWRFWFYRFNSNFRISLYWSISSIQNQILFFYMIMKLGKNDIFFSIWELGKQISSSRSNKHAFVLALSLIFQSTMC